MSKLWDNRAASFGFARIGFPIFRRAARVTPLIVYYHMVSDEEVPHVSNLYRFRTVSEYKRDLNVLLRSFEPISVQDLLRSLRGEIQLPNDSFLLTFDDGFRECSDIIAPILNEMGIPAIFFLCSAFVDNRELSFDGKKSVLASWIKTKDVGAPTRAKIREHLRNVDIITGDVTKGLLSVDYKRREVLDLIAKILNTSFGEYLQSVRPYLDSSQIRGLLANGHAIGGHSIDHPRFEYISLEEQIRQTSESINFVRENFSLNYSVFAFPNSDANVSQEFFEKMNARSPAVDVFFGNHGLLNDVIPINLQRATMEKTSMSAEAILGFNYFRRFAKRMTGRITVSRP